MTKNLFLTICCFGMLSSYSLLGQDSIFKMAGEKQLVKKYTIMERFEPDLILTVSEREKLKAERFAEIQTKMRIIDTMDLSARKREKLIHDLVNDPFSFRLSKTLVDSRFGEDE